MGVKMIKMREILDMIDKEYNYAQDPLVREILHKSNIPEERKHLCGEKNVIRYFETYAKDRGFDYYDEVIHVEGGTSTRKYDEEDVLKVIRDPHINRIIEKLKYKKAVGHTTNGLIPRSIIPDFIEHLHNHEEERSHYFLELTGYTEDQLKLFSIFDEDLINRKECNDNIIYDLKCEIKKLQEELSDLESEQKDIIDELESRGISI